MMKNQYSVRWIPSSLFVVFFLTGLIGCRPASLDVQPVSGKVTYHGEPVSEAIVIFSPSDNQGRGATGLTDANGNFSVSTGGTTKKGALIGEYGVTIIKTVLVDPSGKTIPAATFDGEAPKNSPPTESVMRPRTKAVIPEQYGRNDSPLFQVRVEKGKNEFVFDMKDH